MIFDVEGTDVTPAGLNIGDRIALFIIKHIAGVVTHFETFVADFSNNARAIGPGRCVSTVLLNHNHDTGLSGMWSDPFQRVDKHAVLT